MATSMLFIVLSIPVVTVGAAYAAMHYTMLKTLRGNGQIQLFRTFWDGLKQNWKQATIAWLILLAVLAVLGISAQAGHTDQVEVFLDYIFAEAEA